MKVPIKKNLLDWKILPKMKVCKKKKKYLQVTQSEPKKRIYALWLDF